MNYHYLDATNQPAGPATLEQIRALSQSGAIAPDPMICPVNGSEWKLMSVVGGAPAGASVVPFSGTILAEFVGRLANLVRGILSPALIERVLGLARFFGQYAVLLGGVLGLLASIVVAIQSNSFAVFIAGIGFVIALAVAQYAAARFLSAGDGLIATTPSRLSSLAFLECVGVLAILGAVAWLVAGITTAIQAGSFALFLMGLVGAIFTACFGAIALHPELASVESGSGSAGEEAIGILAFFLKAALKLVPLAFVLLALVGALMLIVGMVARDSGLAYALGAMVPTLPVPGIGGPGLAGLGAVLSAALLPMLAYFAFLLASLPLELWRAILSLPGKLDMLRRAERPA